MISDLGRMTAARRLYDLLSELQAAGFIPEEFEIETEGALKGYLEALP